RPPRVRCDRRARGRAKLRPGDHVIKILDPGPQTTIQDLGRLGQLRYGIPPSGPVDRFAFVLANRLVGNPDGAAALECTLAGPRFEAEAACVVAVTGADMPLSVNGKDAPRWATLALKVGDVVKLGHARSGVRGYVAFAGGLDVPLLMGSRATYLRGRLGGVEGRALRKDDRLRLAPAATPRLRPVERRALPDYGGEATLRVVLGPQADRFTKEGRGAPADAGAGRTPRGRHERRVRMRVHKEVAEYTAKTSRSRALHEEALAVMPGGNSRTTTFFDPYPFYIQRGQGAHIWDADGT